MVEPIEAASKYLSIGENMVRKFQFPIKREQVYRVYPKNFKKTFFSKNSKRVFRTISTSQLGGGQFEGGGWVNFALFFKISVFSPYFRKRMYENRAKKPILVVFRALLMVFLYFSHILLLFC